MSDVASDQRADLLTLARAEVELDHDVDEFARALAAAVVPREAVGVLPGAAMRHLARMSQDAEHREGRDERRRECEQRQDGHEVADRTLGEPEAEGLLDLTGGDGGDEPHETCDDDGLADCHQRVAMRLRLGLHDQVVFARLLASAHQHEAQGCRDGNRDETDSSALHELLLIVCSVARALLTDVRSPLGLQIYIIS